MSPCFNPGMETLPREKIRSLQTRALAATVARLRRAGDVWREKLRSLSAAPEDIRGPEDLARLPITDKADFRAAWPLGFSCVPRDEIAEMHMSRGRTGDPVVMPYTGRDLDQWSECLGRCYAAASAARGDRIQIISSSALFNGGFGFYQGARAAGLVLIPSGAGNYRRQARLAAEFRSRVLVAPADSFAGMLRAAREAGIGLPSLQIGISGGEPVSAELRELSREQGIEVFDVYGLTETGGLGTVGMECSEHRGLHVWEDQCLVEVADPTTGQIRPDGEEGELLVTTLTREALPVLRYRTGDLTRVLSREKCACGRTFLRIAPVVPAGRSMA